MTVLPRKASQQPATAPRHFPLQEWQRAAELPRTLRERTRLVGRAQGTRRVPLPPLEAFGELDQGEGDERATLVGKVAPGGDRLVELAQPTQGPRTLGQQALTFQS